jgi:hypothetical protein
MRLSVFDQLLCHVGLHGEPRSQGLVGFCARGCGDLKRTHAGVFGGWVRYVKPPGEGGLKLPPGLPR